MTSKAALARRVATVSAHAVGDRFRRPSLAGPQDVPRDGISLTEDWLTSVLCADVPDAHVVSWSSPGGSSGTSERAALRVVYDAAGRAAGLPTELFTKSTSSLRQRLMLGVADALHGESLFYGTFRPAVPMEAPRGYWAGVDDRTWRSLVIMEDIAATRGATFVDPTHPLTREQVAAGLANLAALHGTWWDAPDLTPVKSTADHFDQLVGFGMEKMCRVGMERAHDVLAPELLGQADRLWDGTRRSLAELAATTPTLLHGDAHVGQTYLTADGAVGLTDWQLLMSGGWAYDVAYFLGSACEPADRRAWEHDLLEGYRTALVAAGGPHLDGGESFDAYRRAMFYPYSAWALTIGHAWYQPQMQPTPTCRSILHRLSHAIVDLRSFEALGV